jgi:hypothetical protein
MTQKKRILTSLSSGKELSAKQLTSLYKIASPTKVISTLRAEGHKIQLKKHTDRSGRTTSKYHLVSKSTRKTATA